jgi:hypothetical protein
MSRYKIYAGQSSSLEFSIQSTGRTDWDTIAGVKVANGYLANDIPLKTEHIFTVPLMRRPEFFTLRVESTLPFPVSLISMAWEGQYSKRFYTRA